MSREQAVAAYELARMAQQELARRHLLDYVTYGDPDYVVGRHHRLIASQLDATLAEVMAVRERRLASGESVDNRVIITVPPRYGKSRLVSEEYPSHILGRYPALSVIVCSYSAQLAFDFSRRARNRLSELGNELFDVKVSRDSGAVERWSVSGHPSGGLVAAGVGGPITGRGAHVAIVDDPFKNWQEAASPTVRDSVWEWYKSTLRTRLAPGGAVIIVMTRWHEDDLVARLLKAEKDGGEKWKVINLPAVAEDDDLLGRERGEPLWPEMFGPEELVATEAALGGYLWNALYQQRPRPESGAIFKRQTFRYFEQSGDYYILTREPGIQETYHKDQLWCFQTFDPSGTAREQSDYCALGTWLVTPKSDLMLIDVVRQRSESAEQLPLLRNLYARYGPQVVGIESKSMGLTLFQMARNMGMPVVELKAEHDKVIRSIPMTARFEAGKVFFRSGAAWLDELEEELIAFPKGGHDDQVDMVSYGGILLAAAYEATLASQVAVYDDPVSISPF